MATPTQSLSSLAYIIKIDSKMQRYIEAQPTREFTILAEVPLEISGANR